MEFVSGGPISDADFLAFPEVHLNGETLISCRYIQNMKSCTHRLVLSPDSLHLLSSDFLGVALVTVPCSDNALGHIRIGIP